MIPTSRRLCKQGLATGPPTLSANWRRSKHLFLLLCGTSLLAIVLRIHRCSTTSHSGPITTEGLIRPLPQQQLGSVCDRDRAVLRSRARSSGAIMVDQPDDRMKQWAESVIAESLMHDISVNLGPPEVHTSGKGVGLYLLEVVPSSPFSNLKPAPLQLTLKYLVTAWSERFEEAHDALVRLLFAAMEDPELQVERTPPTTDLWRALGVLPQPALTVLVTLGRERPRSPVKLVTQPLRVELVARVAFHGQILGPGEIPLSDCSVEVPSLGLTTSSDREGRFAFAGVPSENVTHLVVSARGRQLAVDSKGGYPDSKAPMLIRFDRLED